MPTITLHQSDGSHIAAGTTEGLLGIPEYFDLFEKIMLANGVRQEDIDSFFDKNKQSESGLLTIGGCDET